MNHPYVNHMLKSESHKKKNPRKYLKSAAHFLKLEYEKQ